MQTIPVEIENGVVRLPANARFAVLLLEPDDTAWAAEHGGAFDFLREEPELYADSDVLPERRNPDFGGC